MGEFRLTVPIPPSVNHAYFYMRGRRIKNKSCREYEALVGGIATAEIHKTKHTMYKKGVKIIAEMHFYFPDKRVRDTHNTPKILLDAIQGLVFENDYWVLLRIMDFEVDKNNPRLEIVFREKGENE